MSRRPLFLLIFQIIVVRRDRDTYFLFFVMVKTIIHFFGFMVAVKLAIVLREKFAVILHKMSSGCGT
ncbi:hypothetical protein [Pseudacidobacterium ailaaui]|uniref:hypothetical protein n=1 Tax=Pseudacidobacterium ailaaui TaxID=1382359 RepID=UPI00138E5081|nr:hypothetical protein [Pseudacidobacterium ailaaui]MBX6360198.1 hypothetical protein [Pseudacidobacterium ailaaui]